MLFYDIFNKWYSTGIYVMLFFCNLLQTFICTIDILKFWRQILLKFNLTKDFF